MSSGNQKPKLFQYCQKKEGFVPYDAKWVPLSNRFVCVGTFAPSHPQQVGRMSIHRVREGKIESILEVEKPFPFRCSTFGAADQISRQFATGDFSGRLQLWDLIRPDVPVFSVKAHSEIINCLDGCGGDCFTPNQGSGEIASVSRDGFCKIWDPRQNSPVSSFAINRSGVMGSKPSDCWSVSFGTSINKSDRSVCVGYDNGDIRLFDLRRNTLRWTANVLDGVCCLQFQNKFSEKTSLVAVTKSKVSLFQIDHVTNDTNQPQNFVSQTPENLTIWSARYLSHGNLLATTNQKGFFHLYTQSLELISENQISSHPVLSLDVSNEIPGLCLTSSLDQSLRIHVVK
mmetsp:Transcript_32664/g.44859  ORF Transcript_32664/g.44859 Transcript_32664/m.44859 type:complete len:343 (-) Transcript_32664:44-1072(-)